jgi:hypothetical protein
MTPSLDDTAMREEWLELMDEIRASTISQRATQAALTVRARGARDRAVDTRARGRAAADRAARALKTSRAG